MMNPNSKYSTLQKYNVSMICRLSVAMVIMKPSWEYILSYWDSHMNVFKTFANILDLNIQIIIYIMER